MSAIVAGVCSALALLAFVVLAILTHRSHAHFLARLKVLDPELWSQVTSTSMAWDQAEPGTPPEGSQFLRQGQYLQVPDPELHRLGDRTRRLSAPLPYLCVATIVFACLVGAFRS